MQNNITNNIVISGDSHANWVSDLVWLDHANYSSSTGAYALGAEFGGTAVSSPCPYGQNITLATSIEYSDWLVAANSELQWSELYYRGYYELHLTTEKTEARYFGIPEPRTRSPKEVSLANFTVVAGENKLERFASGTVTENGTVENGALKFGSVYQTNATNDTTTGSWTVGL